MANIKTWLVEAEQQYGEPILAIVVGRHDDLLWGTPLAPDEGVVLDRDAGLQKLDQNYDNSYGGADCFPCYAWTESRVFMIHEYDGSTGPVWVPRHPVAIEPEFGGQPL